MTIGGLLVADQMTIGGLLIIDDNWQPQSRNRMQAWKVPDNKQQFEGYL